ncbi:ABC transporter permease subunit [Nocardioides panacisoli]|uniref:ABC transporter permease n=1 Tax=Nocardioides panacisoli TaxID=627624 RepID=UPI001C6250F9|nr:ABC transporter permease subunit [Nocardioides panacisoli]QYJ03053.1 ABC transporter permease subunit [Nocardioides panacisoli]
MTALSRAAQVLALPVLLVLAWWFATANSTSFYWPPLSEILGSVHGTWFEGRLTTDVLPSLGRLLAGYAVAVVLGVGLGVLAGSSRTFRAIAEPPLEFLRAIPPPVLVPILILLAGVGDQMKILVIATGCLWPILLNTIEGVRAVDPVLRDAAAAYRLSLPTRVRTVILRGASPQIAAGCRQALSIGLILMVISEMFAATNGLGFTTIQFQRSFAIPEMWSGIILLGVIGVLLALVFRLVEGWLLGWYHALRAAERKG